MLDSHETAAGVPSMLPVALCRCRRARIFPTTEARRLRASIVGGGVSDLPGLARRMFAASLAAVDPRALMERVEFLPDGVGFGGTFIRPRGRLILVALGKAAPGLADAFLSATVRRPDAEFVLAPDGVVAPAPLDSRVRRASHPFPDARGEAATRELLDLLAGLSPADGVVLLLSGGSSSLLAAPLPFARRELVADVTRALMAAGAPICELNVVRKHLLAASGGRMAACSAAPLLTLVVSDVPGDDLSLIASGPTVADPSTFGDALAILERRGVAAAFPSLVARFREGVQGRLEESPKPGDPRLAAAATHILAGGRDAAAAAARVAREHGLATAILTTRLRGEARVVGAHLAHLARCAGAMGPTALVAAGETTVHVRGRGCGGRNLEAALAAALALAGSDGSCILAASTDGVDGTSPAAGAVVDGSTVHRGLARGRDALALLEDNDSWTFFAGSEEALITGPTGTNVADLAFVLSSGGIADFLVAAQRHEIAATLAR